MRVLIVEDEPVLALRLQQVLERADFAVDVAYDGENGWHLEIGRASCRERV